jgi:hypothetical protein
LNFSVEDDVLPGARAIVTREQCESLREPLVAADGSVTQRVQNVHFNLRGDEFQNYRVRPVHGAWDNASSTTFRIGANFDDIVYKQPEVVGSVSRDPCLYRGYQQSLHECHVQFYVHLLR